MYHEHHLIWLVAWICSHNRISVMAFPDGFTSNWQEDRKWGGIDHFLMKVISCGTDTHFLIKNNQQCNGHSQNEALSSYCWCLCPLGLTVSPHRSVECGFSVVSGYLQCSTERIQIIKTPTCNKMCPNHWSQVPLIYLFSSTLNKGWLYHLCMPWQISR